MLMLGFVNINELSYNKSSKSKEIITEQEYYSSNNDKLKYIHCPNCDTIGGLFTGFFWINCKNCNNLYLNSEELRTKLMED